MSENIADIIKNNSIGTFKIYNGHAIGLDDSCILDHLRNKEVVSQQIRRAIDNGFYIEAISLRIQILDFWLRVLIRNCNAGENVQRKEFGNLLGLAKKYGLPKDMHDDIKRFNSDRIKAVHGFILGKITTDELKPISIESEWLSSKLIVWVLKNTGEIIYDMNGRYFNVGDMILDWEKAISDIELTTS